MNQTKIVVKTIKESKNLTQMCNNQSYTPGYYLRLRIAVNNFIIIWLYFLPPAFLYLFNTIYFTLTISSINWLYNLYKREISER